METDQYQSIKVTVKRILNIDLSYYKDEQMRRRLDSWLIRSGLVTWDDYFKKVKEDERELQRFRDYLTINVSEFFRDAERWRTLREKVIPYLLGSAGGPRSSMRIWSAGCSTGQEPYSLAMLMDELTPRVNHYLLATDLDRGALNKARARGPYLPEEIRNLTPLQCGNYLEAGGPPHFVSNAIAQKVTFKEHNMLEQPFEENFNLIVCRNVIIYFTTEAKQILYRKFAAALRPGGILFLGGTEIIPKPLDLGLRTQEISFYVKA